MRFSVDYSQMISFVEHANLPKERCTHTFELVFAEHRRARKCVKRKSCPCGYCGALAFIDLLHLSLWWIFLTVAVKVLCCQNDHVPVVAFFAS